MKAMRTLFGRKAVIILVVAVFLVLVAGFVVSRPANGPGGGTIFGNSEKAQIEAWIKANDLNQYGDSADTVYAGGTPLFNERTGGSIDRYDYISIRHPDKPWESY